MRAENLHPLLDTGGNKATKDEEKIEVLNAVFTSDFNTSCSEGTQAPELENSEGQQMKPP